MKEVMGFFTEALNTGIGFHFRISKLTPSERHMTIGICDFLYYSGWILWYIDTHDDGTATLEVIPQPKI